MSRGIHRGPARVEANMTPMIDVTFLLIVFFVLVSQIVDSETVEMSLPELSDPATVAPEEERRLVINVSPGPDHTALDFRLGGVAFTPDPDGRDALVAAIAASLEQNPNARINLRADRRTHYEFVQPALEAIARGAARVADAQPRVNLVIIPETD